MLSNRTKLGSQVNTANTEHDSKTHDKYVDKNLPQG